MLPDWKTLFGEIHQCLTGIKRLAAMAGCHGRDQGCLADGDRANPMGYGQGNDFEPGRDLTCDLTQYLLGRWVPFVGEGGNLSSVVVIPDVATEGHDRSSPVITHETFQSPHIEGRFPDFGQPNLSHPVIIALAHPPYPASPDLEVGHHARGPA